jgi:predicted P-loop ATPase
MSEAKGTLLTDRDIKVAESTRPNRDMLAAQTKIDDQTRRASYEPAQTEPVAKTSPDAKPKTWTFSISLGWEKPLQIKGTISVDDHAATAP